MIKRAYVAGVRSVPVFRAVSASWSTSVKPAHGWRRWFASLGAIYDLDAMLELDIPWWNVAATVFVERFLAARPGATVFEYGSGASTVWLARRAASVITVEHDQSWAEQMHVNLRGHRNATLTTASFNPDGTPDAQPYVRAIEDRGLFDLIVVDGRLRAACLEAAVSHLKTNGAILFDDSSRRRYRAAIKTCGLAEFRFHGLAYCVPYPDQTSILTREQGAP